MNKKLTPIAAIVATLALAASAHAQTITSIQFTRGAYGQGTLLAPTDVAGVDAVDNWNSATGPHGPTHGNISGAISYNPQETDANTVGLVTSTGSASTVGYSVVNYGNENPGSGLPAGPNYNLVNGGAYTNGVGSSYGNPAPDPVALTLTGLTPGRSYEFLVYVNAPQPVVEASLALGGAPTEYFIGPQGGAYLGTNLSTFQDGASTTNFVTGDGMSPSTLGAYQSNYVEFNDYIPSSSSATITLTELGSFGGAGSFVSAGEAGGNEDVGIAGVQVLESAPAPTPEPASVWLMLIGMLGLGFHLRRTRLAKV